MGDFIGAVDQGTTSTRFIVFDHDGRPVAKHQLEHEQLLPRAGWVEHNPLEIWDRTKTVIGSALTGAGLASSDLAAIGIENAVTEIDIGARRALDDQHLVAADTEAPVGQTPHLLGGQRHALVDGVDHDEVIAEAVHFGETQHAYRLALASGQ